MMDAYARAVCSLASGENASGENASGENASGENASGENTPDTNARGPVPIDWREVDPYALPESSAVRQALLDGRYDVARYLADTFAGEAIYVHSDATHRRAVFAPEARDAVASGALSAREAERVYGVSRISL